jgi:hypothetical protein
VDQSAQSTVYGTSRQSLRKVAFQDEPQHGRSAGNESESSSSGGSSSEEESGSSDEYENNPGDEIRHGSVGFVASVALTDLHCEEARGHAVLRLSQSQLDKITSEVLRRQASAPDEKSRNDVITLTSQASAPAILERQGVVDPPFVQQPQQLSRGAPFAECTQPLMPAEVIAPASAMFYVGSSPQLDLGASAGRELLRMSSHLETGPLVSSVHRGARPKVFASSTVQPELPEPAAPRDDSSPGMGFSSTGLIPTIVAEMTWSDDDTMEDEQAIVRNFSLQYSGSRGIPENTFTSDDIDVGLLRSFDDSHSSTSGNNGSPFSLREELQHQPLTFSPSDASLFTSASIGTTMIVCHEKQDIYRLHLHPGPEHRWLEVLRRASNTIHEKGIREFVAEMVRGDEHIAINVDEHIPQEPCIIVNLLPVNGDWVWKIEDSKVYYHPGYYGQFGPQFND